MGLVNVGEFLLSESLLSRGRYYRGIFIVGSLMSGARYYRGIVTIGGRFYRGAVPIGRSLLLHETSSKVDAAELSFQDKRWELVKTALKQ